MAEKESLKSCVFVLWHVQSPFDLCGVTEGRNYAQNSIYVIYRIAQCIRGTECGIHIVQEPLV